eukprot:TRINITY_DN57637_c0_g1_i1.p1 TRINITY_DN57637_c0_g1~~TRINITY_DN57637_c0_g1_i1.p1  ORF type:complete len:241 (-),score=41.43 TRINITY_DN57637_c0_g1_i1:142-864(-)
MRTTMGQVSRCLALVMAICLLAMLFMTYQAYLLHNHAYAEHATDERMFLVAVTVALQRSHGTGHEGGQFLVRTQRRTVINKAYDSYYDGTHEAIGETVKAGESIVNAVVRGVAEELGYKSSGLTIVGAEGSEVTTTHITDPVFSTTAPYCFVQQLGPPQPWTGLGFVALLPDDATLEDHDRAEVGDATWWEPAELLRTLENEQQRFMGFHYPVLLKVSRDLVAGTLQPVLAAAAAKQSSR